VELLCDTGFDVLDGAKVITAATVLRKQAKPDYDRPCICFRVFQESEQQKESVIIQALEQLRAGKPHSRVFPSSLRVFSALPSSV
jgi:hypothetical protein